LTIDRDHWLSTIFGYDVYKATLVKGGIENLRGELVPILEPEGQGREAFVFSRVDTEKVDNLSALTGMGFEVVDVTVTLDRGTSPALPREVTAPVKMAHVEPRHHEDVLRIAASCFQYSRFHLDPSVSDDVANEVKRAWVSSYIQGLRGETLWLGLLDDRPVGFVAVLAQESEDTHSMVIDLIGVDRDYQGQGVGKQMIAHVIQTYAQECDRFLVGTQVANTRSMRLYERCGFRVVTSAYMLHLHKITEG
jgi:ribosomal protein S18 acetylase RimI-like enzyme